MPRCTSTAHAPDPTPARQRPICLEIWPAGLDCRRDAPGSPPAGCRGRARLRSAALPSSAAAKTVWLCKPGKADNPCDVSLNTTLLSPTGKKLGVQHIKRAAPAQVRLLLRLSDGQRPEDRGRQLQHRSGAALDRSLPGGALLERLPGVRPRLPAEHAGQPPRPGSARRPRRRAYAYADVRAAWRDYLRNYNHGRGVVLIGHSQGTFVLRQLIDEGDRSEAERAQAADLGGAARRQRAGEEGQRRRR